MNSLSLQIENVSDFVSLLDRAGVELDVLSLMDILWLGGKIERLRDVPSDEQEEKIEKTVQTSLANTDIDEEEEIAWSEPLSDFDTPLEDTKLELSEQTSSNIEGEGIPLQVPAAPSLRSKRLLSKALRPLMCKVSSPTQRIFDEEATVTQISEQKIWSIVESPAPERWLDLALVVENSPSTFLWRDTIEELQLLVERQGAFRQIRIWQLHYSPGGEMHLISGGYRGTLAQSRSPKVLLDPSNRQVIWLLSDYTSALWQKNEIYKWLHTWGQKMPVALFQLLPERLWDKSILGKGWPVKLSALSPGIPNTKLEVESIFPFSELDFLNPDNTESTALDEQTQPVTLPLNIPVVTLEPEPLNRLAKLLVGYGDAQVSGIQLDPNKLIEETFSLSVQSNLTTEEVKDLVRHFQMTASIPAQQLAGMMATVPVSLPIINLIRQTMLPRSRQVHVAEVYMSGLLCPTSALDESRSEQYDFVSDEVRDILVGTIFKARAEAVLDAVSAHISKRLGLSTRSFEALIANINQLEPDQRDVVLPFARIATQTLKRLGGHYAKIADQISVDAVSPENQDSEDQSDSPFPDLEDLTFTTVQLIEKNDFGTPVRIKQRICTIATITLEPESTSNTEAT